MCNAPIISLPCVLNAIVTPLPDGAFEDVPVGGECVNLSVVLDLRVMDHGASVLCDT